MTARPGLGRRPRPRVGFLDLVARGFRLLLRLLELAPGVIQLLLGLFGDLLPRFFEFPLGLIGELFLASAAWRAACSSSCLRNSAAFCAACSWA